MTYVLGISALYHDSAAALLRNGAVLAAAQEERFTRKKHDSGYPERSIEFVLQHAGIVLADVETVVFYDKPFLKFERLLETYVATAPFGFPSFQKAMPIWLREKLFLKSFLVDRLKELDPRFTSARLKFSEHHVSHAASAFFPSPFEEALVLTIDGAGEWTTTALSHGKGNTLEILKEIHFPHSLGLLYSAFTYYTGFRVNSGEYKLMGLAPYGEPKYAQTILDNVIDLKEDGSFRLNQSYFSYATGLRMVNGKFCKLFGEPVRLPERDPITQFHMDIAASIQAVTEECVLRMTRAAHAEYALDNLCLAGGVALNCVANGKILRDGRFKSVWVQPAAGDAGGALGAAQAYWHCEMNKPRRLPKANTDAMQGAYLGPSFDNDQIARQLSRLGAQFERLTTDDMLNRTAKALVDGKAVGWFQGRMEFGPRALGGRSILADPRSEKMQKLLNLKVKYRESFRPFAPSVLAEKVHEWFELEEPSPYMLIVADVRPEHRRRMSDADERLFGIDKLNVPRSSIPAVTHVDYSARVQTVHSETNPLYHALISRFEAATGCPVLVNTSFNVRGEPIVCTPEDAFRCFMGTEIEVLAIGDCVLVKEDQNAALKENYTEKYELD
ncbi:carbamoyltransferase [Palleronia marisminoris]|uniref:Decarbamoylnovobiocin carbamoyltransferase n=1 Tax=Palleronia marisminoris TaxID=315423 RepID=A0A1Y5SQ67_9RHOB|nr:carbamoyltransferase [Palleronia marisminoris]SFG93905.1 carbamoyltransferase [Palleronia marisminoris]SLN45861.1 Decarbamoylnovobiocin carbamoyltransferase [Palleronia marisminoris]